MGLRTRYSILKPIPSGQLQTWIAEGIASMPGPCPGPSPQATSRYCREQHDYLAVHVIDTLTLVDDAWPLARDIAARHGLLHMELRAQEGDHWDFTLEQRGEVIADFSTCVQYFNEGRPLRPWKRGDLAAFARAWGVDSAVVAPYLIDWGLKRRPRRVRPTDKYETGDVYQLFDLMPVIGVAEPNGHADRFTISAPRWVWDSR